MKGTTLTELLAAWKNHKDIISARAHAAAGYPDRKRWREIMAARKRRFNRSRIFIRASVVARVLENHELFQYMNEIRGSNGLPKMIHTFGNSGTAKSQREASNAGNYDD